jgi:hypothetical protein
MKNFHQIWFPLSFTLLVPYLSSFWEDSNQENSQKTHDFDLMAPTVTGLFFLP